MAVVLLLIAGCGGGDGDAPAGPLQDQSPAQRDWESQVGTAWEEYEEGFRAGWVESCDAVHEAIVAVYADEDFANAVLGCSNPPESSFSAEPPLEVPDDPRAAGHADGVAEACYVPPEVSRPVEPDC